jgi:ubiquitin thioesterase protein OTUB1
VAHSVGDESYALDHVQMQALAKAMGVNLSVAYLDGKLGHGDAVDFVKFENGGGNEMNGIEDVVLLYR